VAAVRAIRSARLGPAPVVSLQDIHSNGEALVR
jgi:hypothetical protein